MLTGRNAITNVKLPATRRNMLIRKMASQYQLYLFILPALAYFIIFNYLPIYGVQLAFKDFYANKGIWGSPFVGFRHFKNFFDSYFFWQLIRNTLSISLYSLFAGFLFPILLALMLNEVGNRHYKKIVQTVSYAPHFISTVVMVGMILIFLNPNYGFINMAIKYLGGQTVDFINKNEFIQSIYVWSGVWQSTGWGAIIYFAVLVNVDPQLQEAAIIDGASKIQKIWHINIPVLLPTVAILFIMSAGGILSVGFEKIFLMQTSLNLDASDVISTYVYRIGLLEARYDFSTAVGLFNSVIGTIMMLLVNSISKRMTSISLW